MTKREKALRFFGIVRERFTGAEVGSTSVLIAYYLLLSLFPLILAVGNILPLFHINYEVLIDYMNLVLPEPVAPLLDGIVRGLLTSANGGLLSVGAVGLIWSAGRGINYLQKGMNKAYGIPDESSFIAKRLVSMLTVLLMLVFFAAFVLFFSIGQSFLDTISPNSPWAAALIQTVLGWKWPVAIAFILVILTLIYRITPDVKLRIRDALPGAVFSTIGSLLLVQAFTIYVQFATRSMSSYGTLSAFFVLMFWLQFTCVILVLGAVLNASIAEYRFGKAQPQRSGVDKVLDTTRSSLMARLQQFVKRRKAPNHKAPKDAGDNSQAYQENAAANTHVKEQAKNKTTNAPKQDEN